MNKIYLLTDYKGNFGSKHNAIPYRSGMDKELLKKYFKKYNYETEFLYFSEVNFKNNWGNKIVLYTSQEDYNYLYKSYIEDIVYGLELAGAVVIPKFKYLRANNNKVFMEILRDQMPIKQASTISSKKYGTFEELEKDIKRFEFPIVLKKASGAMSTGVTLAKNRIELINKAKKFCRTKDVKSEIRDFIRSIKHKGYIRESKYRNKFIIQNFIPNLENDWKVLCFGNRFFVFKRNVRKNDFRASGSGQLKYLYGSKCFFPDGMLEFVKKTYDYLNTPNLSIDICFDGKKFHIIELQFIYFGTVGHEKSDIYYNSKNDFKVFNNNIELEQVYVDSIVSYLDK